MSSCIWKRCCWHLHACFGSKKLLSRIIGSKESVGKIVVCVDDDPAVSRRIKKLVVADTKAKGLILIDEAEKGLPFDSGIFPFTEVGNTASFQILEYINSTKGPAQLTENILKPDIMATGVAILAAIAPKNEKGTVPNGKKPSKACPHVMGAATFIKSVHRRWTTSMIKSALMTTRIL
ncbi:hypothetical protein C1H46_004144 [Malus baccata]|uniref:Peptidase S8/S53 domain-containing protein n=1 Tax=Malus baccata TaxID=106549 RepID=A0A540NGZ3_MALBA|nr:hypothetical protein C1H46_004144 [Malus baccata]